MVVSKNMYAFYYFSLVVKYCKYVLDAMLEGKSMPSKFSKKVKRNACDISQEQWMKFDWIMRNFCSMLFKELR